MMLYRKGVYDESNLLIIGNGFDKAHGLPTGYGDFLDELDIDTKFYKYLNTMSKRNWKNINVLKEEVY